MAKKVETKKTSASPTIKKKIQRQNTMEQTAQEGQEFMKKFDNILKRKDEEKKQLKKENEKKKSKNAKKSPKKSPLPPKKPKSVIKKASSSIKVAASKKKTKKDKTDSSKPLFSFTPALASVPSTATAPSSLFYRTSMTNSTSLIQNDIDSCSKIASTEVIHDAKLGYQIIKKSLQGKAKPEGVKPDKKRPLRTVTGDKLAAGMVDVVFCCDTTSSMTSYLTQCKSTVQEIIKKILEKTEGEGISVKFGFVAYRDHPPQDHSYLTCSYDLTSEEEIKEFISQLNCYGGGDTPEAVMDGLYVSAKHMSWRDSTHIPSLRYIFHIADAPPHGKEYGCNNIFMGSSQNECLCKIDINKISHIINMRQIHYRFVSTDNMQYTKKMAEIFKEKITDYEECSIGNAAEMDIKISEMIIRELLPDMVEEDF